MSYYSNKELSEEEKHESVDTRNCLLLPRKMERIGFTTCNVLSIKCYDSFGVWGLSKPSLWDEEDITKELL